MIEQFEVPNPEAMASLAARLIIRWRAGDLILLEGALGAGKTTFVRGAVAQLGNRGPVRSPTFNLLQTFETTPPVMHADLYRVSGSHGIGLEDYLETHLCLIEWPDRLDADLAEIATARLVIDFAGEGRRVTLHSS